VNCWRRTRANSSSLSRGRPRWSVCLQFCTEAVLEGSGLDVSALRPSVIYGEQDRFLNMFARCSTFVPILPLACADARFQPVWVEDVAAAIAACLARPETAGQTSECAGPDVFTLAQLVRFAGEWSGHKRPIVALPRVLGTLQAAVMEQLPGEPVMSRDNLQSMQTPNVLSGRHPTLEVLGIRPAALKTIGPGYLGREHAWLSVRRSSHATSRRGQGRWPGG
jgi:hypothetical protein